MYKPWIKWGKQEFKMVVDINKINYEVLWDRYVTKAVLISGDLQVSVATRCFCRVLTFVSS